MCEVFYCPDCRIAFRTDGIAMLSPHCEKCHKSFLFCRDPDSARVADHIGIPTTEWEDLTR